MTIKVQCPNPDCGHVLTVRDEYAGKRGKCPACGSAMMIPSAAGRGAQSPMQPPREKPRSDELASPTAATDSVPLGTSDDLRLPLPGLPEPITLTAEPPQPLPEPALPPAGQPPPAPSPFASLLASYSMAELATRTALVVGIVALVLLSFLPQSRWLYLSEPAGHDEFRNTPGPHVLISLQQNVMGVNNALLVYSALLAVLAVCCLVGMETLPQEKIDAVIAAVSGLAGGWGVTVFFWLIGFIWKAFTTASHFGSRERTVLPGFGPLLGFFAALAIIAVFGYLAFSRRRFIWLGAAGGLGFFFGILLLIFNARPWEPWPLH